jgi:hypothetical protein
MAVTGAHGVEFNASGRTAAAAATPHAGVSPPLTDCHYWSTPTESRWLDVEYYTQASDGFASYDPEHWLPTLSFSLSDFMFMPWCIISGVCLLMTIYVEVIDPDRISWVDAPIDAHVILGGALSFLVVMRTDAS